MWRGHPRGVRKASPDNRMRARDAGIARLKRATRVVLFGATALAGAFAGLAAHSLPGHKSAVRTTTRTVRTTTQAAKTSAPAAAATRASVPAPPPPPVTTQVAPVATTGVS